MSDAHLPCITNRIICGLVTGHIDLTCNKTGQVRVNPYDPSKPQLIFKQKGGSVDLKGRFFYVKAIETVKGMKQRMAKRKWRSKSRTLGLSFVLILCEKNKTPYGSHILKIWTIKYDHLLFDEIFLNFTPTSVGPTIR